jgi:hypothetical protein
VPHRQRIARPGAPSAIRIATSLRRSIARATSRPATFAQAINNTNATAQISTTTAGLISAIM